MQIGALEIGADSMQDLRKLPQELVDIIIAYIVEDERTEQYKCLSSLKRCYDESCTTFDHFSEEELWDMRVDLYFQQHGRDLDDDEVELEPNKIFECVPDEQLRDVILDDPSGNEKCWENGCKWTELMTMVSAVVLHRSHGPAIS